MSEPEAWLRGPVNGIAPLLQPAAHALLQVRSELHALLPGCSADEAWATPGGAPSVGYHARHLAGSTDRLLTYAAGRPLDEWQLARLRAESIPPSPPCDGGALWREVVVVLDEALEQLRAWSTNGHDLLVPRAVGRAQLPSTLLGLLFHAAEHAQRHAGQVTSTLRIVRGLRARGAEASSA